MKFRHFAATLIFFAITATASAETLVIAVPQTEFPALAAQMIDGATAALNGLWIIKTVDAGCQQKNTEVIADLILAEKPDAVIGLPCIESLMPALAALGPKSIPIITIASRAIAPSKLAVKNKWPLYRIGPREREEIDAIATLIVELWRRFPFAILDDGTIFARDTAEAIRNAAESAGVRPRLVDGFEPQRESQKKLIDRLVASGATHVFIASDRANIAQIASEVASEAANVNLTIAGPETLRAGDLDFQLPAGVLMAARNSELNAAATAKILAARQIQFAAIEGYTADAYVAAEIAMAMTADNTLSTFKTASGDMTIAADGFIEPVEFVLFRFDGTVFQKVTR